MTQATTAAQAPAAPVQKRGEKFQRVFNTLAECEKACEGRTKGPRWPFEVKLNGKTYYAVALSPDNAFGAVGLHVGGTAERIGGTGAKKALSEEAVQSALDALTPEAQARIKAAIDARLKSAKAK